MPYEAIAGDTYPTTPGLERRNVSTYVIAKAEERYATSTGLAVRHTERADKLWKKPLQRFAPLQRN